MPELISQYGIFGLQTNKQNLGAHGVLRKW